MPCLVLLEILEIINKSQFLFFVKYAVNFVWWKHVVTHTQANYFNDLNVKIFEKQGLSVSSLMMENVLVNFEDTGYSFYFVSNYLGLRSFEGDPGFSPWGRLIRSQLQLLLVYRKHTGNHLHQVSPFKLVGIHLLLKFCLVCISRLGVKIVESFQFEWRPDTMCHGWSPSILFWLLC